MGIILFSALFGAEGRPERVKFLEQVQMHMGGDSKLVAFNTSADVGSETLTVVNALSGRKLRITEPQAALGQ
jgi:hypothetical protein